MMVSRGSALTINGGSNASCPEVPTLTVNVLPSAAAGVGPGEPGNDLYVVVQVLVPRVMTAVKVLGAGSAGIVTPPEPEVVEELLLAEAFAALVKLKKEFGWPSAPQLIAKTIPFTQWLLGVLAP